MATYFNPNHDSFLQAVNRFIYVDKTGLLEYTNSVLGTESKCIALSHARRFGKSQVDTERRTSKSGCQQIPERLICHKH